MAMTTPFAAIEDAIEDIRDGRFVVVVDDPDRENEGDLVIAAQFATPETINFMATHGRGLICLCLTGERADRLELRPMTERNEAPLGTAFTVSIEAREGVTTGISAADRSHTIQVAIAPDTGPSDLVQPGHVFPLRAKPGGVLERIGQTEAAVDLARMAGLAPAGVICEIMNEDGTMARMPQLKEFSREHGVPILTIADLIRYRMSHETLVRKLEEADMPTARGHFRLLLYEDVITKEHHAALVKGEIRPDDPTLVRAHSQCLTGDTFGSARCDCGEQLRRSMEMIEKEGKGVILYILNQEGRGIGLVNKLRAYQLQDAGFDTIDANEQLGFDADERVYSPAAEMLKQLGYTSVRLLTNNPDKVAALQRYGIAIVERVPHVFPANGHNERYLNTKASRSGHIL